MFGIKLHTNMSHYIKLNTVCCYVLINMLYKTNAFYPQLATGYAFYRPLNKRQKNYANSK